MNDDGRTFALGRLLKRKLERQTPGADGRPVKTFSPGVLWEGVLSGWSGYAKANRETMFRAANHLAVEARQALEGPSDDLPSRLRIAAHERTRVGPGCPFLRFFGPDEEVNEPGRRHILWTMMETGRIHPGFVDLINTRFDELWTPTEWNRQTLIDSGLLIPSRVMGLGVDSLVYRTHSPKPQLPECRLISTQKSGATGIPEGFLFLSVGLPSFRKGFDILCRAFEDAFYGDPSVGLVIATTHMTSEVPSLSGLGKMKSRIWALEGSFDEPAMARIYGACDAYVSASRGEGFALPLCEAAAVGLPCIVPDNTCHPEVSGDGAFLFKAEGEKPIPGAESVSTWYKGMTFSNFGKKSHAELADLLRLVRKGGPEVIQKRDRLRKRMLSRWTWDKAAERVARRLLDLQP